MGREPRPEHVRDKHNMVVFADRADHGSGLAALLRCPAKLGMGVTDLMLGQSAFFEIGDERPARQAVVDLPGCACIGTPDGSGSERHRRKASEDEAAALRWADVPFVNYRVRRGCVDISVRYIVTFV